MAEAYGNVVQHWQCYINAYVISTTDTTATIRVEVYGHTIGWGYNVGGYGSAVIGGAGSGERQFNLYAPTGGTQNSWAQTYDRTVNRSSSAYNVAVSGTVRITGGYHNGTSTASTSVSVPAISYRQPYPPNNCSVSRVSDTQQKLSWQANYTDMNGLYPWSNVLVDRAVDGGSWQQIATLDWSALNYSDNSTGAGHSYQYGLRSKGPGGTSTRAIAGTVVTTPLAPTSVTLAKVTDTQVSVNVSGASSYTESYEMQSRLNGGDWGESRTVTSFPVTDTPGAGKAMYRVRAVAAGLYSAWTESDEIATITPPLAPAVSLSASVSPTGSPVTVSWVPNHIDGTDQVAAQVELVPPDGSTMTVDVDGATSNYVLDDPAKGRWRIRVRTKGLDPSWGEWSTYAALNVADPPQAWFTSPAEDGAIVDAVPLSVAWEAVDATGISSQTVRVSGPGVAFSQVVSVDVRSIEIDKRQALFQNDAAYALSVTVSSGSGLSVTAERRFSIHWKEPPAPEMSFSTGDGLSAAINVFPGERAPETVGIDVYRVFNGETKLVQSGMAAGEQAIDPLPPLNVPVRYIAVANAESGSQSRVETEYTVNSDGFEAFNFGNSAGTSLVLGFDASVSESVKHTGEEFRFALGADTPALPTFYPDGDRDVTGSASYVLTDPELYQRARSLFRANPVCWYRDAFGNRATVTASFRGGYSADRYGRFDVSLDMTEVVWEEPNNG